jgi:hydroxymethylpyrimidine/phosphomethylpyrimidine kinase
VQQCAAWGISEAEFHQTPEANHTVSYTRYVLDVSNTKSLTHLRVATAPCLLGYGEIGNYLYNDPDTKREGNPYWRWIQEYAGDDYQEVCFPEEILSASPISHRSISQAVRIGLGELEKSVGDAVMSHKLLEEFSNIFGKVSS